jgi:tRNA(fMet)-specific endonuclease VapC
MVEKSRQQEANRAILAEFLQDIPIYQLNEQTAQIYGQLKTRVFNHFAPKDSSKRRKATTTSLGFGDNDLWIASVALQHRLTLISCDRDFQRLQEAQILPTDSWI